MTPTHFRTAKTNDNPKDTGKRTISITFDDTKQTVEAMYMTKIDLDHREQKPNVLIGTEVMVVEDTLNNHIIIGSIPHSHKLQEKKRYTIINDDVIDLQTNTFNEKTEKHNIDTTDFKEKSKTHKMETETHTLKSKNKNEKVTDTYKLEPNNFDVKSSGTMTIDAGTFVTKGDFAKLIKLVQDIGKLTGTSVCPPNKPLSNAGAIASKASQISKYIG